MKNKFSLVIIIPLSFLFSSYDIGDQLSVDHQNMEFGFCYPETQVGNSFSFAQHNGDLNGGNYKVLMIEVSASWWAPCFAAIPEGDEIVAHWEGKVDNRVSIIHFLDDIGQPYSCSQWGNSGTIDIPLIVDDGVTNTVVSWFENPSSDGSGALVVFLDHTMTVTHIMSSAQSFNVVNAIFGSLLDDIPALSNENSSGVINQFNITRLYPNPFNPVLNIDFDINQAGWVKVNITDITGSMVKTVYEGYEGAGKHHLSWDSDKLPSGTYFVTLEFENSSLTKKVVLLK